MPLSIECPSSECSFSYSISTDDFESQSESSGTHTTQLLESGSAICPKCKYESEVKVLSDVLDDTDEVLTQEVSAS